MEQRRIYFYHISTDGTGNGIVHICDGDYEQARKISAVLALRYHVRIICYAHMSTHSHFVVWCYSYDDAAKFAEAYKREYSRYMKLTHNMSCVYRKVNAKPKVIKDITHLKNCIAYVLLNPVAARIVNRPEDYKWTSIGVYFGIGNSIDPERKTDNAKPDSTRCNKKVSELTINEIREIFRTRGDLKHSGFVLDCDGHLDDKSFVDYRYVENLFKGILGLYQGFHYCNSAQQEEIYVEHVVKYNDNEVRAEAERMAEAKYGRRMINELTKSEKIGLLQGLKRKTGASDSRIGRALWMDAKEVKQFLGAADDNNQK